MIRLVLKTVAGCLLALYLLAIVAQKEKELELQKIQAQIAMTALQVQWDVAMQQCAPTSLPTPPKGMTM
jgi:hypothetical protein